MHCGERGIGPGNHEAVVDHAKEERQAVVGGIFRMTHGYVVVPQVGRETAERVEERWRVVVRCRFVEGALQAR